LIHPIHTTPDAKNIRADQALTAARYIRAQMRVGRIVDEIHDDLVPSRLDEGEFYLAWQAALVLLK